MKLQFVYVQLNSLYMYVYTKGDLPCWCFWFKCGLKDFIAWTFYQNTHTFRQTFCVTMKIYIIIFYFIKNFDFHKIPEKCPRNRFSFNIKKCLFFFIILWNKWQKSSEITLRRTFSKYSIISCDKFVYFRYLKKKTRFYGSFLPCAERATKKQKSPSR